MQRIRPLALGELLDRSVNFWRQHWKPLFQLMVGFQLAQLIAMKVAQVAVKRWFPLLSSPELLAQSSRAPDDALPQLLGAIGVMGSLGLFALFISEVSNVAAARYGWPRVTGTGAPSTGDAFRHAAQRLPTTLGAFALSMAWSAIVAVLLLLPAIGLAGASIWFTAAGNGAPAAVFLVLAGLTLAAGLVVLVLWFIIRFVMLSQILAVEDVGAWAAFRRADVMSSGRVLAGFMGLVKVRLTVLITVMGGVLLLMSAVTTVPTLIAGGVYGAGFTPGRGLDDVVPALVLVPIELLQTVLGAVIAPLYVMFQLFFYVDMRSRREGLDLDLALGTPSP